MSTRKRIADRAPDPRLRIEPEALGLAPLPRRFFLVPTERVARALLSCWIARRWRGRWYGGRLVETEAYLGPGDRAAHSWGGRRTPRVEPMYAEGGHLYVFFVYGMHNCANVVTRRSGVPEAVLLRAAEGPAGAPERLMAGPGRLCAALGITVADSGRDLLAGPVAILRPARALSPKIATAPRVGVDYAGAAAAWPVRYCDLGSGAVSVAPRLNASRRRTRPPRRPGP